MATDFRQETLGTIDEIREHTFLVPVKQINEGQDVPRFLVSRGYRDIMTFLTQLNRVMFPLSTTDPESGKTTIKAFGLDSTFASISPTAVALNGLLKALSEMIDEVPLDTGPRRFGNVSFRRWYELLESRATDLLKQWLPSRVSGFKHTGPIDAIAELRAYLLGSFGSSQRLDYGTGHELSFLAFLGGIWKLGGFESLDKRNEEISIVLGVIQSYLDLVRKLIQRYTLEPAGSHGVWGLDDHSFLPYIFGSAQYGPAIGETDPTPTEGSLRDAPDPGNVAVATIVQKERRKNMYFGAIGFIYDVKKGPFWEHSPTLYDISGVRAGWGKINKGMVKMYNAEVLSKFPVIQHFPFGSLFSWDHDPDAESPVATTHTSSQPIRANVLHSAPQLSQAPPTEAQTPWAAPVIGSSVLGSTTQAPWAIKQTQSPVDVDLAERRSRKPAEGQSGPVRRTDGGVPSHSSITKAPWAK